MRSSSVDQLDLFQPSTTSQARDETRRNRSGAGQRRVSQGSSDENPFASFGKVGYAENARIAGRIQAANVSKEEHDGYLRERELLLQKMFNDTITRKEMNRLEYIRWTLDRIDDAQYGENLDRLEILIETYERLAKDIRRLESELKDRARRR